MKKYIAVLMGLALTACLPQYTNPYKIKDYTQVPLIEMPVTRVEIKSDVSGLQKNPHVEHLMPMTPEKSLKNWALIRLRPTYQKNNKAEFVIKEASMIREEEKNPSFFTYDNYKYTLTYAVTLQILDEDKNIIRTVEGQGVVIQSQPQKASERERDTLFSDMLGKMEEHLDTKMTEEIIQNIVDL